MHDNEVKAKNSVKRNIEFMSWIQEFSKKVVVITFAIFIVANLFFLGMILVQFITTNEILYLDTFISEMHSTFREVIGGYLIKAAIENAIKIGGSTIKNYLELKSNSCNCANEKEDPMSPAE